MKKEDLILRILKGINEDECLIVGDFTVKNIIMDSQQLNEASIKKYMPGEYGHEMGIAETMLLIYASIQAIDSFLNIISKFKRKNVDAKTIEVSISETLIEKKIPDALLEDIKKEIIKWLENEMD